MTVVRLDSGGLRWGEMKRVRMFQRKNGQNLLWEGCVGVRERGSKISSFIFLAWKSGLLTDTGRTILIRQEQSPTNKYQGKPEIQRERDLTYY
jgi:hypothetical protein